MMSINLRKRKKVSIGSRLFDLVLYLSLIIVAILCLYPMYHVFIISISSSKYISQGLVTFLPKGINFDVYKIIFDSKRILNSYKNTIIYTTTGTAINLIMTALCAYPLSRKDFYGRRFFTVFVTLTMFLSGGMIPLYLVVDGLNLTNTIWAIVLPGAINTFNMIVMRTSFEAIPRSLTESSYIDGANDIQIFRNIILPLSKPVMATMTLYYAVGHWNSYFSSILYLNDQKKYPVQVILRDIVIAGEFLENSADITSSANVIGTNYKYGVIIVTVVPIILIYPFIQKHFAKGVMIGAIKG